MAGRFDLLGVNYLLQLRSDRILHLAECVIQTKGWASRHKPFEKIVTEFSFRRELARSAQLLATRRTLLFPAVPRWDRLSNSFGVL
jgi:hypothetical protein